MRAGGRVEEEEGTQKVSSRLSFLTKAVRRTPRHRDVPLHFHDLAARSRLVERNVIHVHGGSV